VVIFIFALSFGPFLLIGQAKILLSRLFPFKRGLSHAYWAPNVWAMYNFIDRVLSFLLHRKAADSSLTRGLVGDVSHLILPSITPSLTFLLTIAMMMPILISVYKNPYPRTFPAALNYCLMCSYMLGWHVHEKAVLMLIIPLGLEAMNSKFHLDFFIFFSTIGHYSIYPLLFKPQGTLCFSVVRLI
jgi:alpha-1,3-glucosyltransferase